MVCKNCGKDHPSDYYFKPGGLCAECWEQMTPEERQRFTRASGLYRMTTTAFELPGHTTRVECLGVVRGIVVRSRSLFGTIGGALQTVVGGNITLFSELCERTRSDAFEMLLETDFPDGGACAWADAWAWASGLFNHSAWLWMVVLLRSSEIAAALPGAWFHVGARWWMALGVYSALFLGLTSGWLLRPSRRLVLILAVGLAAWLSWRPDGREVTLTVLPLRGGDSLLFNGPGAAGDMLVDTGDAAAVGFVTSPFLAAQGVNWLPTLVLTHGDIRHVGGALAIFESFRPRQIITGTSRFRSPAVEEAELRQSFGLPANMPLKNLGMVELHTGIPRRVSIRQGEDCTVTATVLTNGAMQLNLHYESKGDVVDGVKIQPYSEQSQVMLPPGLLAKAMKSNSWLCFPPMRPRFAVAMHPIIVP